MKDNWEGKLDFQRAELMVRKLAQYVVEMRSEGRSLLAVEHDFEVRLPDLEHGESGTDDGARHAVLRGQVDRLEIDAEGRLVIVDLKTGKRQPGKADVARHPQLGAYQVAVLEGAFEDAGVVGPNVDAGSSTDAASARARGAPPSPSWEPRPKRPSFNNRMRWRKRTIGLGPLSTKPHV